MCNFVLINSTYLLKNRTYLQDFCKQHNVQISVVSIDEAKQIMESETVSFQKFGVTNYKDCSKWSEQDLIDSVLDDKSQYQLIHFYHKKEIAKTLYIAGHYGGYTAFLTY